jgi:sec-independent protein translocase protein TatB
MFNIGSGEIALIAVVALLVLGPKRLPELARGLGKFLREFRRQTDEVRNVVEREFYKMDTEMDGPPPAAPQLTAAADTVPTQIPDPAAAPISYEEDHKFLEPADPMPAPLPVPEAAAPATEPAAAQEPVEPKKAS